MKAFLVSLALGLLAPTAWALYDPPPAAPLAGLQGRWQGELRYRDYQSGRWVRLPTVMHASLAAPDALGLHWASDDGPGKVVHSYERLQIDAAAGQLRWATGLKPGALTQGRLVATDIDGARTRWTFLADNGHRHTLEAGPADWRLVHEEPDGDQGWRERSRVVLARPPG